MTESGLGDRRRFGLARDPARSARPRALGAGLRLGRIFGIEVFVDWSLAIIFTLITLSLGVGVFPSWHPDWGPALVWGTSIAAAVLFFASVLAHELSHALVGRRYGVEINRITLFLFGGVAHMEGQPATPRAELWMAAVGPATSAVIGVGALAFGTWLAGLRTASMTVDSTATALSHVGPVATLFLWLGPINLVLALFNLVPGFPLDGGRVLRALLWWGTGDLERATRWASLAGQFFAWTLMGLGLLQMFSRDPVQGIWLVLIGWFLNNAARAAYQQVVVHEALESVPIARVMRTRLESVSPELSVSVLVRDFLMQSEQRVFPVEADGVSMGLVSLQEVRNVAQDEWDLTAVAQIMVPLDELPALAPELDAERALEELAKRDVDQLPVIDGGRLLGLVDQRDLFKWLTLHARRGTPFSPA